MVSIRIKTLALILAMYFIFDGCVSMRVLAQVQPIPSKAPRTLTQHHINEFAAAAADALDELRIIRFNQSSPKIKSVLHDRMVKASLVISKLCAKTSVLRTVEPIDKMTGNLARWSQIKKIINVLPSRGRAILQIGTKEKSGHESPSADVEKEFRSGIDNVQSMVNLLRDARP